MENDRKWLYLSYFGLIALVAWVLHKAIVLGLGIAHLPNPKVLQVISVSALVAIAISSIAGLIYFSQPKVNAFALEVLQELKKVTWPAKDMAYKSTIVVVVVVMIASAILGFFDYVTNWVIGLLLQA